MTERERYTRRCAEAAAELHRAILGSDSDGQIARFLAWVERTGIGTAVEEAEIKDFSRVHEHLLSLYRELARRFLVDESNTQVQRRALRKLDITANKVLEANGFFEGLRGKLRSWSIVSPTDVGPLTREMFRSRIFGS